MTAHELGIGNLLALGIESELVSATYRIAEDRQSIRCLLCGFDSLNLNDVSKKECPRCGTKHESGENLARALEELPKLRERIDFKLGELIDFDALTKMRVDDPSNARRLPPMKYFGE